MLPIALTIAGSDPSGGAGIQADLKTFHQFGVYGEAVVTLLTAQNTLSVERVIGVDPDMVEAQIRAVLADLPPQAAKLGALGDAPVIERIVAMAPEFHFPLVIDPVMVSKHGAPLMSDDAARTFRKLLPHAALLTPNLPEITALTGLPVTNVREMRRAAKALLDMGVKAVLAKGGHLKGEATDLLALPEGPHEFTTRRIASRHTHGTGCTYSAAITAELAKGTPLVEAVARAKRFVTAAIATAPGLGGGAGPLNHFARVE